MKTWKVILAVAKIRQFQQVLQYSEEELPEMKYHRKCYQIFTMKSNLKLIEDRLIKNEIRQKEYEVKLQTLLGESTSYEYEDDKPTRRASISSSSTSTVLLPGQCLFCKKSKSGEKNPDKLRKCCDKRVADTIMKATQEKEDFYMIPLISTIDIISAEPK